MDGDQYKRGYQCLSVLICGQIAFFRRFHVHHEKTHCPQNGAESRRSKAGAAVSRSDGPRRHCAGPNGSCSQDAGRLLLHPSRRHHVQHLARARDGQVDAQRLWRRFQAQPNPRFARTVQEVHIVFRQFRKRGYRGIGAYVQSRDMAQRHASGYRRSQGAHGHHARSGDRQVHRPGHPAAVSLSREVAH